MKDAIAMYGLGALPPEEAVCSVLTSDADGQPVTADKSYVLHFGKEEMPPVDAFWSLTMYDENGFPVPNAMNRQSLSSWMPLKYNPGGSLDLYVQAESPGKDR